MVFFCACRLIVRFCRERSERQKALLSLTHTHTHIRDGFAWAAGHGAAASAARSGHQQRRTLFSHQPHSQLSTRLCPSRIHFFRVSTTFDESRSRNLLRIDGFRNRKRPLPHNVAVRLPCPKIFAPRNTSFWNQGSGPRRRLHCHHVLFIRRTHLHNVRKSIFFFFFFFFPHNFFVCVRKSYYHYMEFALNWTASQMMLTIKLTGSAYEYFDGRSGDNSKLEADQRARCVQKLPTLLEWLSYCYFFPTLLVGPPCGLSEYISFTDRSMFKNEPGGRIPSCMSWNGIGRKLFMAVVSLTYHFIHAK